MMICGKELEICENCEQFHSDVNIGNFCGINGVVHSKSGFMVRTVKPNETCKLWSAKNG
jgi:hypothetical protein